MSDWRPTPKQIALLIDCSRARVSLDATAKLVGVQPWLIQALAKRLGQQPFASVPANADRGAKPAPKMVGPKDKIRSWRDAEDGRAEP